MSLRAYFVLWAVLTAALSYESYALNHPEILSLTKSVMTQLHPGVDYNFSPEPGRPLSLFLGWTGFLIMCVTNLYILRKRLKFLRGLGNLAGWLDFHIFCGMIGPTLVIFHTNFKVHGLVSISFWSMVIVAVSGIVGRYFYGQVLQKKGDLEQVIKRAESELQQWQQKLGQTFSPQSLEAMKAKALSFVGGAALANARPTNPVSAIGASLVGDARLIFFSPKTAVGFPAHSKTLLKKFALAKRHHFFYETFQSYLGYWHAFHLPFAFFMYIVAVIHIAAALVFGV